MDAEDTNELAERAGVPAAFVDRLVELGIVARGDDGRFGIGDVHRARFAWAADHGGLPIDAVARAMTEGAVSLGFLDTSHYRFAPRSAHTYAEVADEVGLPVDYVLAFEEATGRVRPAPDDAAPEDLPGMLQAPLVALAAGVPPDAHLRFVRVYADALGRIAENEGEVFHRLIELPRLERGMSHSEMLQEVNAIGSVLTPGLEELLLAIYRRQQERVWTDDGVQHLEAALEALGLHETTERPIAFAFIDLAGYTRLTDERGDEAAAELAAGLARLVHEVVGRRDGRAVKWLGDGVMSSFRDPVDAVLATIEIGRRVVEVGLPPAHAGVAAGPVVYQDGDYYGRTVNLASRLAGAAAPSQTLVDAVVRRLCEGAGAHGVAFRRLAPVSLKGIAEPVEVFEASDGAAPA